MSTPAPDNSVAPDASASVPLLLIEISQIEFARQRYISRPVHRVSAKDEKRGPESVARFANSGKTGGYGYEVSADGVATVKISGILTPEAWAWYDDLETITDWVVRDLGAIESDAAVKRVLFINDSPGGYVAGSYELADAIAHLAAKKPTATATGSYCCSAAYLLASQTGHITAFRTSIVGSIGTRSAVVDWKEYFTKFGVKVIPIDSGGMKSAGLTGTEITPEQVEYFKGIVMSLQSLFTEAVAKGRRVPLTTAQAWADGRVHVAGAAKAIGLIDAVGSIADARTKLMTTKAPVAAVTRPAISRPATPPKKKSALQQFSDLVQAEIAAGVASKQARKNIIRKAPDIHRAMLRETNPFATIY